jgi:hypothetical protein
MEKNMALDELLLLLCKKEQGQSNEFEWTAIIVLNSLMIHVLEREPHEVRL